MLKSFANALHFIKQDDLPMENNGLPVTQGK